MSHRFPLQDMPAALRTLMARLGPVWGEDIVGHTAQVRAAYLPLLQAAPRDGVRVVRDLAYGAHARQILDIYLPAAAEAAAAAPAPVVLFVHGGAFVRGDKDVNAEIFANVLTWFARQGCIGVNIEYRLADIAPWPGGAEDVAAACAWVRREIAGYGGDPQRMCLIGHSAGGTHVASYAFDPALGYRARDVSHLVLISARLRADTAPENPNAANVVRYFGADPALFEQRSPLTHGADCDKPMFIVCAEYENPLLDIYGLELAWRVAKARGHAPRYLSLRGHNHTSIMAHFNTREEILGREILDFFLGFNPS